MVFYFAGSASSPDLHAYISSLPGPARPHLELELDWGNHGVEKDLAEIADHMSDWEKRLSTHLGLTYIEISDIKKIHLIEPALQR